jgi:tetratricopeptide (TPR) repeat protein
MRKSEEEHYNDELQKARASGEEHLLDQALVELANYYRFNERLKELQEVSEERYLLALKNGVPGDILIHLAANFEKAGQADAALLMLERTRKDIKNCGLNEPELFFDVLTTIYVNLNDYPKAVDALKSQMKIAAQNPEYSDYWERQNYLAELIQFKLEDPLACIPEREQLWQNFRKMLDDQKLELTTYAIKIHIYNAVKLAQVYKEQERFSDAVAIYETLVADLDQSQWFAEDAIEIPYLYVDLAELSVKTCNEAQSIKFANTASELLKKHPSDQGPAKDRIKAVLFQLNPESKP